MELTDAILARRSVRGFLQREVPRETLVRAFATAQRAPSWCNTQPWRVAVFSGGARTKLVATLREAVLAGKAGSDFPFPDGYPEPYATHRKESGKALYAAMGVSREDLAARQEAWLRNFVAFDAPHVALVGIDKRMGFYAGIDVGCWLSTFLLACAEEGIGTCAQASLAAFAEPVRPLAGWDENVGLAFGIAIGFEDDGVKANAARTSRAPLGDNVTFVDAL